MHKTKKSLGLKIGNNFVRAKKALGQNFLKSQLAIKKIIETGEIKPNDIVLEIGPGKGILTEKLLLVARTVLAIEKDRELFEFLKIKFEKEISEKKLILINDDILKLKIARQDLAIYKIIANIPYNITGAILKKFLTEKHQPEKMVLMVQHEVAQRITTPSPSSTRRGKESLLSISVKAYGTPKLIMKVPARYFSPSPKVDSAVIEIKNISRKIFEENKINEEKFWEIVHLGFAHKRKKLSGNLKQYTGNACVLEKLKVLELKDKRAEELTLKDWISLAKDTTLPSLPLSGEEKN